MGLGILAALKGFAPLVIYIVGIVLFFAALSGKGRWTLLLVAFLIPLRNVVERIQAYPGGTKFLTILILAMTVGWIFMGMGKKIKFMEKSPLNFIAILLILYTFISLGLGSKYLGASFFNIGDDRVQDWKNFCMMPMLFFITANTIRDKKWVGRLFAMMCFAMALMAYYTFSQVSWFSSLVSRAKISGTFQFLGPNEVAAFFDQYTLLLMSVYFFMRNGFKKRLLLLLILANLYCVVFMYSRGAYFATAVGMFVLFAIKNKKLLIPLILAVIFWQAVLPERALERITETTNEYGNLEQSAARRLSIWFIAWELFQQSPVVGVGFGVFRRLGYDLGDTHNIYLKILVEQGLIGIIIFLIVCFGFFREGLSLYRKGDDDFSKGLGLGLAICTLVMMINNFFGDRWGYFELGSYLWIYAGLVVRLKALSAQSTQIKPAPRKKARKASVQDV